MEAANYIIKPFSSGRLFILYHNNANIIFIYQKHKMISVKNLHSITMVNFEKLCKDKSHTNSDEIKI